MDYVAVYRRLPHGFCSCQQNGPSRRKFRDLHKDRAVDQGMRTVLSGLVLTAALAGSVGAQSLQIDATSLWADHELLGRPLFGASVTRRGGGPTAFRVVLDYAQGHAERTGTTCYGLIAVPCPQETLNDRGRLVTTGVGLDVRAFTLGQFSFTPTGDMRLAFLDVRTHGRTSGDDIEASKRLLELMLGARAQWMPTARFGIQVSGDLGTMHPLTVVHVADGYTPLENDFRIRRISIGGIWTPNQRRVVTK